MPRDSTNWPTTETEVDEITALLIRARGFIARGWCQHIVAISAKGNAVKPVSKRAVAWCMVGALRAATETSNASGSDRFMAGRILSSAIGGENLSRFNDRQKTVEPVLAAFDRAIAGES